MTAPRSLRFAEARARVLGAVSALPAVRVPLDEAVGRALREPLVAPHALPPFANTAMDGYAVRSADLASAAETSPVTLRVVEVLPAGHAPTRALVAGEAARIMTGAMLPGGADTIVPFEEAERSVDGSGERCVVRRAPAAGEHIRSAGADVGRGETVFESGRQLSQYDLALAAALGAPRLLVSPRPRVAVLSTGDELLDVADALRPGAIRDSNLPMLAQLVRATGCELTAAVQLPDAARVREALEQSDAVLTIGGVSAGDFDPVKEAIAGGLAGPASGSAAVELWRVAMRPGRPQAFGMPGGRMLYAMPGNPRRSHACSRPWCAPRCAPCRASPSSIDRACPRAPRSRSIPAPAARTSSAAPSSGATARSGRRRPGPRSRATWRRRRARTRCSSCRRRPIGSRWEPRPKRSSCGHRRPESLLLAGDRHGPAPAARADPARRWACISAATIAASDGTPVSRPRASR